MISETVMNKRSVGSIYEQRAAEQLINTVGIMAAAGLLKQLATANRKKSYQLQGIIL